MNPQCLSEMWIECPPEEGDPCLSATMSKRWKPSNTSYPRIVIALCKNLWGVPGVRFTVYRKDTASDWWDEANLPLGLISEAQRMLGEYAEKHRG